MSEFDTEGVADVVAAQPSESAPETEQPKRRGRPPLSDEEKVARAEARKAAKDTAPKRGRPAGRADLPMIEETLSQFVTAIGVGLSIMPNERVQIDGVIIVQKSDAFVKAWCELARTDKRVYNALRKLCVGGAWGGVIMASCSIVIPVAANHGLLPPMAAAVFGGLPDVESDNLDDESESVNGYGGTE